MKPSAGTDMSMKAHPSCVDSVRGDNAGKFLICSYLSGYGGLWIGLYETIRGVRALRLGR